MNKLFKTTYNSSEFVTEIPIRLQSPFLRGPRYS